MDAPLANSLNMLAEAREILGHEDKMVGKVVGIHGGRAHVTKHVVSEPLEVGGQRCVVVVIVVVSVGAGSVRRYVVGRVVVVGASCVAIGRRRSGLRLDALLY